MRKYLCIAVLVALARTSTPAATLTVGSHQTYSRINDAIAHSHPGDSIIVHDGTYAETVVLGGVTNLTISGSANAIIKAPLRTPTRGANAIIIGGSTGITISGLTVQTTEGAIVDPPAGATPPRISSGGSSDDAIQIDHSSVVFNNLIVEVYGASELTESPAAAVAATDSEVTMNGGKYVGVFGRHDEIHNSSYLAATRGGPALRSKNSELWVHDALLAGGPGGGSFYLNGLVGVARMGGNAFEAIGAAKAHFKNSQLIPGTTGHPGLSDPARAGGYTTLDPVISSPVTYECDSIIFLDACYTPVGISYEEYSTIPPIAGAGPGLREITGTLTNGPACGTVLFDDRCAFNHVIHPAESSSPSDAPCQLREPWWRTSTLTVGGGAQYASINAAIGASEPYDTIQVADGTYNETVIIGGKKHLTISGSASAIIKGELLSPNRGANAIIIGSSKSITISGLTVRTTEGGIADPPTYPGSGARSTGGNSDDAIQIDHSSVIFNNLAVEVHGVSEVDENPAAAVAATESDVTLVGGRYIGALGRSDTLRKVLFETDPSDFYYTWLSATRGGPGLRAKSSRIWVDDAILMGGPGGASYYINGPTGTQGPGVARMGGNGFESLGATKAHFRKARLLPGTTGLPGQTQPIRAGGFGPLDPTISSPVAYECGANILLEECDTPLGFSHEQTTGPAPFFEYGLRDITGTLATGPECGVVEFDDICLFADQARILGIPTPPQPPLGDDGVLDAADLVAHSTSGCEVREPWWR